MAHAREEYLFQYSIYVLESCTSRRLTYFLPPTNLIPLLLIRPLRLVLPSDTVRQIRVMLLRAVSIPFVALIWCYEGSRRLRVSDRRPLLPAVRTQPWPVVRPLSDSAGLFRSGDLGTSSALRSSDQLPANAPPNASIVSDLNVEDKTDLIALIQKLSAQVDNLTAMVAAQKAD